MFPSFASLFLVLAIFGSHCHQAPATTRNYEVGSVYTYDYVLGLELNEPPAVSAKDSNGAGGTSGQVKPPSTVGYKVLTTVQVRPVWQNEPGGAILEITLSRPQLQIKSRKAPHPDGFRDHTSQLDSASLHPLYVYWKDGIIQKTYSVTNDDISFVNIKKGIANLLQIPTGTTSGTVDENTPMGQCKVTYESCDTRHVTKHLTGNCEQLAAAQKFPSSTHSSRVLGADVQSNITVRTILTREAVVVEESEATERHTVRTTAKQEVGATINTSQSFKLTGTTSSSDNIVTASSAEAAIKEIAKISGLQMTTDSLVSQYEKFPQCEGPNCKNYDTLIKSLDYESISTNKMASAFIQIVTKFRDASADEIEKILNANKKNLPALLDACAAAGTPSAHKAAMKVLDFEDDDFISNPERYLLGLSLSPTPAPEAIPDLFNLIKKKMKSSKLQETLVLSIAALVNTLRTNNRRTGSPALDKLIDVEVEDYIVKSLEDCTESSCQQMYLRALKNLKSKATLPKLFEIIQSSDPKTGVVAMKAVHAFPDPLIAVTFRPTLLKVVQQLGKKYDSSARTLALDILLRNKPTREEVLQILHLLKNHDSQHAEVTTFMWNRVQEFMETNSELAKFVNDIITEEGLQTYHHLAPKGLSTAFSRTFTSGPSGNTSFSNAIEMSSKILKRSSFDVYIKSSDDSLHLLSLGIFAGGLSSFASSNNEVAVDEESEDATAGMELTLMGVQLRPIVFFTGKGELMSLVWSGAGSERTSAIKGNVLLQDEKQVIPLYCGLVTDINIQGGLSFELAGQVQISLWYRTANSLVENKAALVLQSTIRVDTSFVKSRVDYTVAAEASLHFTSDINFSDGVLMCLKLTQPEFNIRQNIHKTERIPGSKHRLRKAKYKTTPVPGITYALNKKNSQLCGVMYKDEL
ncbi:unnamed protein product [Allacma fusca]|uniref:Vitellogenin domain-containing protein n=1 Tax=Allacma fusca TaxID=39272 RepID=A0A8J2LA38_9HEXA|nr:unnamed protein product [Allacma fusca]